MRIVPKIAQLSDIPKEHIFRVPDAYFERFVQRLQERNVLGLNVDLQQNPMLCPDQYFETLSSQIEDKIYHREGLGAAELKDSPFGVPEQYFENMPSQLAETVLPVGLESPLDMPEDYFETLGDKIDERIYGKPGAKVVRLYPDVVHYAVAASVVILMSVAFYFYRYQNVQTEHLAQQPQVDLAKTMIASLSKKEVQQYLEQQEVENQDLLEYASAVKKEQIHAAFEKEILPLKIKEQERKDMELELDNIDISDITSDI